MKKTIAIMLCLAVALGCAAAFAQTAEKTTLGTVRINGAFEVSCLLPEGYTIQIDNQNTDSLIALISSEDTTKPLMFLNIMFDEIYADVNKLEDLSEEDMAFLKSTFTEEYEVEFSFAETASGHKLLVAREVNNEMLSVYTIYQGYEFEVLLLPTEAAGAESLTDAQIQMVVDLLSNLDFTPIE